MLAGSGHHWSTQQFARRMVSPYWRPGSARYNRALALAKTGDSTAALDELERAADDPAAHADAVRTLVDLSRQVNDKARLQRWVVEAARLDRDAARNPGGRELLDR